MAWFIEKTLNSRLSYKKCKLSHRDLNYNFWLIKFWLVKLMTPNILP